ncbi:MAG TPA: hypothetical protein VLL73_05640 [Desulfurivibrionaceae bacterium]|nr:hypothetical protein [Desulfurivibrionaceae bacterium]
MRRHSLLLLVLLALALAGCGKKTRPVPPGDVQPAAVSDLAYELDEKGVTLTWSLPTQTVKGGRLPYVIEKFELYRAVVLAKDYCEGCPLHFGEPVEIPVVEGAKGQFTYQEALLRPGHRYVYRVRSRAGWLVSSDLSNQVAFLWDTPSQAPDAVRVTEGDQVLTVSWQPPAGLLDGTVVRDPYWYQVYRSTDGKDFSALGEPISTTQLVDKQVKNNQRYHYMVRAIRMHDGTEAAGLASAAVSGMPRDMMPPAPPQQVTVVASAEGIKLVWDAVLERDLAGFRIYRRLSGEARAKRIGEVGASSVAFVDSQPPRGMSMWHYAVTAYDQAGNESQPSMEVTFGKAE